MAEMILVHTNPITLEPTSIEIDEGSPISMLIFEGQYKNCAWVEDGPNIIKARRKTKLAQKPSPEFTAKMRKIADEIENGWLASVGLSEDSLMCEIDIEIARYSTASKELPQKA